MATTNEIYFISNLEMLKEYKSKSPSELLAIYSDESLASSFNVTKVGETAMFSINGMLVPRTPTNKPMWFLTPTYGILDLIYELESDPTINEVLINFNSGGGDARGIQELASYMRSSRLKFIGYTDTISASASYWLMSACDLIVASPSAMVGSVGVYINVWKTKYESIDDYYFYRGKQKLFGNPEVEMTQEEKDYFEARVEKAYQKFTRAVAEYRGVEQQRVIDTEAGVFSADEVVGLFVDKIMTLNELLRG